MTTTTKVALLAWAALLYLVAPVHADTLDDSLRLLCGPRGDAIAGIVRAEARRNLLHPVLLASVIAAESRCRPDAVGAKGEIGLGQLLPTGAGAGYTRAQLRDPETNVKLTAAHLARCLLLCGDFVAGGLSVYRGVKRCKDSKGSRRVLGMVDEAKRQIQRLQKARQS
jgi:hypothetical protein